MVNKMLGKEVEYRRFEEVRHLYENFRARCSLTKKKKTSSTSKYIPKIIGFNQRCICACRRKKKKCICVRSRYVQPVTRKKAKSIEKGCTNPLYGVKSKCVLKIVPVNCRLKTFKMDPRCRVYRRSKKSPKKFETESHK